MLRSSIVILFILVMASIIACNRKPFVEHEVKVEKQSDGCDQVPATFKMISNFGGERYEFAKCLPASFKKEELEVVREGDTVVVRFPGIGPVKASAVFNITLDIDSYPRYNHLSIDGETYSLQHSDAK